MLNALLVAVVVVGALIWWRVRWVASADEKDRARVIRRLNEHDIEFVDVKRESAYGWPRYLVVFDSVEKGRRFRSSQAWSAVLEELHAMHGHIGNATTRFEAEHAIVITPHLGE